MRKRMMLSAVIAIVVVVLIVLVILFWRALEPKPAAPRAPISVAVLKVSKQSWPNQISVVGYINAIHGIMLKADASGFITKVFIQSGQKVKAGDPLYQVNPKGLTSQLVAKAADVARLKNRYEEMSRLYKENVESRNNFITAKNNYLAAVADYQKTEKVLALALIRAPFDGTVGLRILHLGDYVPEGGNLISMQQPAKYRVDFQLPSRFVNVLRIGQVVTFTSSSLPGKQFKATIYAIDNAIDNNTDLLAARALVKDPSHQMLSGLVGRVLVRYNVKRQAIVVPQDTLNYTLIGPTVFVVHGNTVKQVPVTVGDLRHNHVAITTGVNPGDVVVTSGGFKLKDGSAVKVVGQS